MEFQTEPYEVELERAREFAAEFDPLVPHIAGDFVSGLYLISCSNLAVIALASFTEIRLGRDLNITFIRPAKPGRYITRGNRMVYDSTPKGYWHRSTCVIHPVLSGKNGVGAPVAYYDTSQCMESNRGL